MDQPSEKQSGDDHKSYSAPLKPDLDTNNTPCLKVGDAEGWVRSGEHLVHVSWAKCCAIPGQPTIKAKMENLVVEASILKQQAAVEIRLSGIGKELMFHDTHISVYFPILEPEAHVYVGPHTGVIIGNMEIWRRDGKPTIVLC